MTEKITDEDKRIAADLVAAMLGARPDALQAARVNNPGEIVEQTLKLYQEILKGVKAC